MPRCGSAIILDPLLEQLLAPRGSGCGDHPMCAHSQQALRAPADAVVLDLDLASRLRAIGEPSLVGSVALGGMVARDIDLTVAVLALPAAQPAIITLGTALLAHSRVRQVTLRDDTGGWNTNPGYPDGWYLGIQYVAREQAWTLDIWFVDQPDRQPDLAHLRELAPRITDQARQTIVALEASGTPTTGRSANDEL